MYVDIFFLERIARVFVTFFIGTATPPRLEAASVEVPEPLAPLPPSPVQAHHASSQLLNSAPSPLDTPKTPGAEVGSCESQRTPSGRSAKLSRDQARLAQLPQPPGLWP